MKNAGQTLEKELEAIEFKGYVLLADRPSFSLRMIERMIEISCPQEAVSLRTIQRAVESLRLLGVELSSCLKGNTPYFDLFSTELILLELKFKVQK
jgi:predicted DNA-binding transcriptional regulator YafY